MMDSDERSHVVLLKLGENVVVELEACFVGGIFVSSGENPAPPDGEPVDVAAHFCHEGNIFFVVVVEIDCFVAGIISVVADVGCCSVWDVCGVEERASGFSG